MTGTIALRTHQDRVNEHMPQPCPWCAMNHTVLPVITRLDVEAMMQQWGVMVCDHPDDLWSAYCMCSKCWARGPQGTAITKEAACGVAVGRWSEMVEWHRQSIALGKV